MKEFKGSIIDYYKHDRFYWVRIFKIRFVLKDVVKYPMLYSQRNNERKVKFGNWVLLICNLSKRP